MPIMTNYVAAERSYWQVIVEHKRRSRCQASTQPPSFSFGNSGYDADVSEPAFIETDSGGRVVLLGHPRQRYLMRENEDGSILLQPALIVTEAQLEYDTTPELRNLLARATAASTVRQARSRRR